MEQYLIYLRKSRSDLEAEAHGEGEQANIHAQHYIEALAFAKRLLKDQQDGAL